MHFFRDCFGIRQKKAEEKSEDQIEEKEEVEATEVIARPRRNCKKKFDSLADLASKYDALHRFDGSKTFLILGNYILYL